MKINGIDEVRRCEDCGKPMADGFVIDGGFEYYCSEECLHKHYTKEEWLEMYGDGETDSYWTEWEEDFDLVDEILEAEGWGNENEKQI